MCSRIYRTGSVYEYLQEDKQNRICIWVLPREYTELDLYMRLIRGYTELDLYMNTYKRIHRTRSVYETYKMTYRTGSMYDYLLEYLQNWICIWLLIRGYTELDLYMITHKSIYRTGYVCDYL